jgi:hypothetical protein
MYCIVGVIINCDLLLNWVGIYLYLVIANKTLTNFKSNAQLEPSSLVSVGAKAKTLPFARCLHQSRCANGDDDRQSSLFVRHAEGRRPMARSPHPAASPNTEAHVQSGPS